VERRLGEPSRSDAPYRAALPEVNGEIDRFSGKD
jgi:hypothetical protein